LDCITESPTEYNDLVAMMNTTDTMLLNPVYHSVTGAIVSGSHEMSIAGISALQPRGGGIVYQLDSSGNYQLDQYGHRTALNPGVWSYTVEFIEYNLSGSDTVSFNSVALPNVQSVGDEKRTAIYDDRLVKAGISEPVSYSASVTVECLTKTQAEYTQFVTMAGTIGTAAPLVINGVTKSAHCRITDISSAQPRGDYVTVCAFSVSFSWYVISGTDTASFGVTTLPNVQTVSEEKRTAIVDDRLLKAGYTEPVSYSGSVTLECIASTTTEYAHYTTLSGMSGTPQTLTINGTTYLNARITDISAARPRGNTGTISLFSVSFSWYVLTGSDTVTYGITLPNVQSVNSVDTVVSNPDVPSFASLTTGYAITQTTISVDCIGTKAQYNAVLSYTGIKYTLTVNTKEYLAAQITRISAASPRGNGDLYLFTVTFESNTGEGAVTAYFGPTDLTVTPPISPIYLPYCTRSAPDQITPVYPDGVIGASMTTMPYSIRRTWYFDCVYEYTNAEMQRVATDTTAPAYTRLLNLIGTKSDLYIGDNVDIPQAPFSNVFISDISSIRPRGNGKLLKFSVEFTQDSTGTPIAGVLFGTTVVPNATQMTVDYDIIQSKTVMHNGTVDIDTNTTPPRRYSFQCMSESSAAYIALAGKIGTAEYLTVGTGNQIGTNKFYISQLSSARTEHDGSAILYTFSIEFEEKTAA